MRATWCNPIWACVLGNLVGCGATTALPDESGEGAPTVVEAARAPEVNDGVIGTWYACAGVVEFAPDGRWSFEDHSGCSSEGSWSSHGDTIDWHPTAGDCGWTPAVGAVTAVRHDSALVLHSGAYSTGTLVLLDETTPRSAWKLTGRIDDLRTAGTNLMHVVGSPREGFASACYFSPEPDWDGLLSTGGWIEIWKQTAEAFVAKTSCSGACPCGAVLSGEPQPDGSIAGHYNAVNCGRLWSGAFTLTPLAE